MRTSALFARALLTLLLPTSSLLAADVIYVPVQSGVGFDIRMSGEIQRGDASKLTALILSKPIYFMSAQRIFLNSKGGSVEEALLIADLVELTGLATAVNEQDLCASACFLVFVSGSTKASVGKILIHRPYFDITRIDSSKYSDYSRAQRQSTLELRRFLESRSVPSTIVDKMMSLPSNQAYELNFEDKDAIGILSPMYEEIAIAKCGVSNSTIYHADAARLVSCMSVPLALTRVAFLKKYLGPEQAKNVVSQWAKAMKEGFSEHEK